MSGDTRQLGSFAVEATMAEADAFRRALGLAEGGDTLPLTYPMRWLAAPAVRDALVREHIAGETVLVHEAQSFAYEASLHVARRYVLAVSARSEVAPDRLIVEGTIADGDDTIAARIETVLRLVAMRAVAA